MPVQSDINSDGTQTPNLMILVPLLPVHSADINSVRWLYEFRERGGGHRLVLAASPLNINYT
jgi:hypothetical protein